MQQYSGDFLAAVDGLRALLGCRGRVWPVSVERATLCAEYADGSVTRGEVEVDKAHERGHRVTRLWLEPHARIHPAVREAIGALRRRDHRAGQLLHQPDADAAGARRRRPPAGASKGPIILVTNLLTEGRGMHGFTAADAVSWIGPHDRPAGRRRHRQRRTPVRRGAGALSRRAQGAARRSANVAATGCEVVIGPLLAVGHRAPRSPPPVVCRLVGAEPTSVHLTDARNVCVIWLPSSRRWPCWPRRRIHAQTAGSTGGARRHRQPRASSTATSRCRSGRSPRSATRSRRAARCCRSS